MAWGNERLREEKCSYSRKKIRRVSFKTEHNIINVYDRCTRMYSLIKFSFELSPRAAAAASFVLLLQLGCTSLLQFSAAAHFVKGKYPQKCVVYVNVIRVCATMFNVFTNDILYVLFRWGFYAVAASVYLFVFTFSPQTLLAHF